MKSFLLVFLFPFVCEAQLIKRSVQDTARAWQIETAVVRLKTGQDERMDAMLRSNGASYTLQLSGAGGGIVMAGDRAVFLLDHDSTATASALAAQPLERKAGTYRYDYAIGAEELDRLSRHETKALRKYDNQGYEDFAPDKESAAKLKELCAAFVTELKKKRIYVPSTAPQFPGGKSTLLRFLNRNLKPLGGLTGAERRFALAQFSIAADGSVGEVEIKHSAGDAFDEEILRLLKRMPNWKPATENGRAVAAVVKQPFTFLRQEGRLRVQF